MTESQPAPRLDETLEVLSALPGPGAAAAAAARDRQNQLTKPPGSLGRLEDLAIWLASWQGRHPPRLQRPRVAVFAGNHGVAARRVSAYPSAVTAQMVRNFERGGAAVNQLCQIADAELQVYELDLDHPTRDFTTGPAMDEEECCRAMAYGMTAVEPGVDLLCLGEMGIGNTTAAAALSAALFGGTPTDWVGPGTGVCAGGLKRKIETVTAGLEVNRAAMTSPLHVLRCLGGYELAAIAGAVIAARLGRVPVLLDGYTCTAAAAVLQCCHPAALDHCVVAHLSAEPAHLRLVQAIGKLPLLDFGMRLGEGSGAALAIPLLRGAVGCLTGMATFDEAGVSGRD